jgi:hypothetical protein
MSDEPDLFGWPEHARRYDPDTSKETARRIALWSQCIRVLRAYGSGRELIDHDAYRIAGFPPGRTSHQRCSDLRDLQLIERTGARGRTPSGHSGYLCRITGKGMAYLASIAPRETE